MQDHMEELQNTLINVYIKNIDFLKNNYPTVFQKVNKLSDNINNGQFKETLSLEYIDDGYFDILDLKEKKYLYGFNSYTEADKRADFTDFTGNQSINLLRVNSETNQFAQMDTLGELNPLVNFINNYVKPNDLLFSKIYKYIFIGTGAGIHIHEIYKKINPMNTLIIEPNLELFRLSLFLIDYSSFTKENKQLFLSIDENQKERMLTLLKFSNYHSYMNYNIKHHLFHHKYEYLLNDTIDFYLENNPSAFPYHALIQVFNRTCTYMNENHKFLKNSLIKQQSPLNNKPILIISAGPSLDSKLEWISENQKKFIIISVDVILKKLEKHNIIPHIVVSIDPSPLCANYLTTNNKNFLKNSAIIFLSQQDPKTIDAVKDLNFYFSQVLSISKELDYTITTPNVGTFSFAIAIALGANELYLIGNDAAFNQETGNRYAKDSSHIQVENLLLENKLNVVTRDDILEVKGNFKEKIKSTRDLLSFKSAYESFIHLTSHIEYNAYNLSDGAFIEGLIPLNSNKINTKDFKEINFSPIEELDKCSILVTDINFKDDIKVINNIISKVNKFKKIKLLTKNQLMREKLDLMIYILEKKKNIKAAVFGDIFLKFLDLIDIYINFFLNIKEESIHNKDNLNMIKDFWSDALISLLKNMKKTIN